MCVRSAFIQADFFTWCVKLARRISCSTCWKSRPLAKMSWAILLHKCFKAFHMCMTSAWSTGTLAEKSYLSWIGRSKHSIYIFDTCLLASIYLSPQDMANWVLQWYDGLFMVFCLALCLFCLMFGLFCLLWQTWLSQSELFQLSVRFSAYHILSVHIC